MVKTHTKSFSDFHQSSGGASLYSCINHLATNSSPSSSSNLKVVEVVGDLDATEPQLKLIENIKRLRASGFKAHELIAAEYPSTLVWEVFVGV